MPISSRQVTSAAEMRALAHPLRLELLELLGAEGAFTASEAARRLGESPANVSWHLRMLCKHGFVRQGAGPGRSRPWKFVGQSLAFGDDAEDPTAATALSDLFHEREFHVLRTSLRRREQESEEWREATSMVQSRLWLTADEARDLGQRLYELFADERLLDRNQDAELRPEGSRLMAMMSWIVPFGDRQAGPC